MFPPSPTLIPDADNAASAVDADTNVASDLTNVDLLFLRKARGLAPLSRFAIGDDGALFASVPDEMEARTFHIVRFETSGRSRIRETYNVETLRRTEIGETGARYVGASDDALYLFRDGRKTRFLPDRRASYSDVALAAGGERFATVFCDLLAFGYAVAFGDSAGRLLWTKDIAFPLKRVAVDRAGRFIALGGETGDLVLLNAARETLWRQQHEAAIVAVATTGAGRTVWAGGGGVGCADETGRTLWFTPLIGEPLEIALDDAARTVAVLSRLDDTSGRLVLLTGDSGVVAWDVDFEDARPTGLSLSANGAFAAVSLRDGSLAVYALHYGERMAGVDADAVLAEARNAHESGNYLYAAETLRARLHAVPSDAPAAELLTTILADLRNADFAAARNAEAVGDWAEADIRLAAAGQAVPFDDETPILRRALRARWAAAALVAAENAVAVGDNERAETKLLEAIGAAPLDIAPRARLGEVRRAAAVAATEQGRALIASGKFTDAIAALTEAQKRGASGPALTALLRDARVGEALAIGGSLYHDRQYAAALFQFKKVLRLDPVNTEALQKIAYAQNFLSDTQINDRFSRLE